MTDKEISSEFNRLFQRFRYDRTGLDWENIGYRLDDAYGNLLRYDRESNAYRQFAPIHSQHNYKEMVKEAKRAIVESL